MKRWILLFNLYNINYYVSIKGRLIPWFFFPFFLFPLSLLRIQPTYYLSNFSLFLRKLSTQMTVLLYKNDENDKEMLRLCYNSHFTKVTMYWLPHCPVMRSDYLNLLFPVCRAPRLHLRLKKQMAPARRRLELTRKRNYFVWAIFCAK